MSKFGYMIMENGAISLYLGGKMNTIPKDHVNYSQIIEAIKNNDEEKLESLVNPAKEIEQRCNGNITFKDGMLSYKGHVIKNALTDRILRFANEKLPFEPMLKFLENLMENPSKRAVDELYSFLETNKLPITSDGHFLAYKRVRADYTDSYTGTISNKVGEKPSMLRNMVNDNKEMTCESGLHFCSLNYLKSFYVADGHVMILKVNPKDVVSIPVDYNNTKGRCCAYEVLEEYFNADEDKEMTTAAIYDGAHKTSESGVCEFCKSPIQDCDCDMCDGCDHPKEDCECDFCYDCGYPNEDCICDDDDTCEVCGCNEVDCECNEDDVPENKNNSLGTKPSGEKFWNVRDKNGKFRRKNS